MLHPVLYVHQSIPMLASGREFLNHVRQKYSADFRTNFEKVKTIWQCDKLNKFRLI